MITYEVNLKISNDILNDYMLWLKQHIHEMLEFSGFLDATMLKEYKINETNVTHVTILYIISSKEHLEEYLRNHAERMRDEALDKFPEKFSATRRFFEVIPVNP